MSPASIRGAPASVEEAVEAAAAILREAKQTVVAGLATDIAGAEAAVELAQRIGGVVDHVAAGACLRDLEVMRQAGWIVTTPLQARARADTVLLAGTGLASAWPGFASRLRLDAPPALRPERGRRIIRLCPGTDAELDGALTIDADPHELPALLGVLRAVCAGRAVRSDAALLDSLAQCAGILQEAAFGVVLWSAAALDGLGIEMLCGLIDDLNATARFAGLPLAAGGNAAGVAQACGWTAGFPFRTSFAGPRPEHDPWRFEAARMVESGEAHAVVWIAAIDPVPPPWRETPPTIALVASGTSSAFGADVEIAVGRPGVDHLAVLFDVAVGSLVAKPGTSGVNAPSVADVLRRMISALGAQPC